MRERVHNFYANLRIIYLPRSSDFPAKINLALFDQYLYLDRRQTMHLCLMYVSSMTNPLEMRHAPLLCQVKINLADNGGKNWCVHIVATCCRWRSRWISF